MEIAKAIILQILQQHSSFLTYLYDECVRSGQVKLVSEHDCVEILDTLLGQLVNQSLKVFLILDGIDECGKKDRKAILKFFIPRIEKYDIDEPGKIRAALVSQELADVRTALHRAEVIQLTQERTRRDIHKYADQKISKLQAKFPQLTETDKRFISERAVEGAEGMFLFTKLVLKNLLYQENMEGLQQELAPGTFPRGLEQA